MKLLIVVLSWGTLLYGQPCKFLLERMSSLFPEGWYQYIGEVKKSAQQVSSIIVKEHPHIQPDPLNGLLEFAFENAAGHGSNGAGSNVSYQVTQTPDGWIEIEIRNARLRPLPVSLAGKVFTPRSVPEAVPDSERNNERGIRGIGTMKMVAALPRLIVSDWPVGGEPSMHWNEIEESGKRFVSFVLRLPPSTRVLRQRRPSQ